MGSRLCIFGSAKSPVRYIFLEKEGKESIDGQEKK